MKSNKTCSSARKSPGLFLIVLLAMLVAATLVVGGAYAALMYPLLLQHPLDMYVRPRLDVLRRIVLRDVAGASADE